MASDRKPHFVLVPFFAQGHMIPMVEMAHLMAARGALVSFITTPVNADRIRPVIDEVKANGLPIRFVELKFPSVEAGLPEGCENVDMAIPKNLVKEIFIGIGFLREPLTIYLREVEPAPSCMIVDYFDSFTAEVARELKIPRLIFHGSSCFYLLCFHNIVKHKVFGDGLFTALDYAAINDIKPVPGLPQLIEVPRAHSSGWFPWPGLEDLRDKAAKSEEEADGVVLNTFYELEPELVKLYREAIGKPVWPLGPLSLSNKDVASKGARGSKSSIDEHQVLSWLDSMDAKSVVYVSFGSIFQPKPEQLIELGCGLEASNQPFIWVIKEAGRRSAEFEKWMSEGFEVRTKKRSLIFTGWVPQVLILSHPSIGGFMTHCGWNSVLEAVASRLPMITWPQIADQFFNEKLVVQVLKVGVSVGTNVPSDYVKEGEVPVKRDDIEKAISSLMDGGNECKAMRARVADLGQMAHKAMELGGSSYENLSLLIDYAMGSSNQT